MSERNVYHELKIHLHWWREINGCRKTSELRRADRDFQVGDSIRFCDSDDGAFLGSRVITHVLYHVEGLEDGFVVLSLNNPRYESAVKDAQWYRERAISHNRAYSALKGVITKQRNKIAQLKDQLKAAASEAS